jgi:lipoprotein-anchoring transpeptidase ErfK/SrfK
MTTSRTSPGAPQQRAHALRRRRRHGWGGFVDQYGWRAYALPILSVVTVAALVRGTGSPSGGHPGAPAAAGPSTTAASPGSATASPDAGHHVRQEGYTSGDTGFRAGSTPAPVVIHLKSDAPTSCSQNGYRKLILVSLTQQHLWACQGHRQVDETPVTTGRTDNGDQTPVGSWRVQAKQRNRYLVGPGYKDYVKYWMPFNGDFGLHDAPWQTMAFGSPDYHTRGSHGCVHVPAKTMAWLYHWATVGGTVVTVES